MSLKGKIAIVTGASSGIGEETALQLSRLGAKVVLAARREDRLKALQSKIQAADGVADIVVTDVTVRSQVEALVTRTMELHGKVDILVNNAGLMPLSMMKNLHIDEWERMIDVNLKGALYAIGAVLKPMMEQKSGHIINVSSVAGRRLFPGGAVYCGTKFGLRAISEGLRSELSPTMGIRVTTIEPGAVATELLHTITDNDVLKHFERMKGMKPLESIDIANSIVYALSQPDHVDVAEIMVMPTQQP